MKRLRVIFALLITMFSALPATAQQIVSEIRAGVMAHDAYPLWLPWNLTLINANQIEDVSFDILFTSPDVAVFDWLGSPKPNFGATFNLDGQENMAHLALTWQKNVLDGPVFIEASLGAAVHDGILKGTLNGPNTNGGKLRPQGCRVQIYTGLGIGMELTDNVTATLSYEHMSNMRLCSPNYGLSNLGLKLGWKFD